MTIAREGSLRDEKSSFSQNPWFYPTLAGVCRCCFSGISLPFQWNLGVIPLRWQWHLKAFLPPYPSFFSAVPLIFQCDNHAPSTEKPCFYLLIPMQWGLVKSPFLKHLHNLLIINNLQIGHNSHICRPMTLCWPPCDSRASSCHKYALPSWMKMQVYSGCNLIKLQKFVFYFADLKIIHTFAADWGDIPNRRCISLLFRTWLKEVGNLFGNSSI